MNRIFGSGGWIAIALFVSTSCSNEKVPTTGKRHPAVGSIKIDDLTWGWHIVTLKVDGNSRRYLWHEGFRSETLVELK